MEILVGAASDIGNVKDTNQDNFFAKISSIEKGEVGLFAMCDGMGGLSRGEVASFMAVKGFKLWFDSEMKKLLEKASTEEEIIKSFVDTVMKVNKEIMDFGAEISERVGTTVSALLIVNDKYYIAHVGDSRVYKLRKKIEQLTEDHTFVAVSVKNKTMTIEEAKVHPRRHALVQCVGVREEIQVYTKSGRLHGDEWFLLCSDGLYNTISDEELYSEITKEKNFDNEVLQEAAERLVKQAKAKGERDNISAIIIGLLKQEEGFIGRLNKLFKS